MIEILVIEHSVAVTVFAALAYMVTRVIQHAPLVHLIWLLVLLKFVLPSPVQFDVAGLIAPSYVSSSTNVSSESEAASEVARPGHPTEPEALNDSRSRGWTPEPVISLLAVLAGAVWASGSTAIAIGSVVRLRRFRTLLRYAETASLELEREVGITLRAAGLSKGPVIAITNARVGPCLAAVGVKPVMLVPKQLSDALTAEERQTLLAHEIAHFHRSDHWLVWFDVLVVSLFWWHPVVWMVRRARRLAAEECCDGWVMQWLPDKSRIYAGTLMKALDFAANGSSSLPVFASGMGRYRHFKRRFEMILNGRTRRSLGRTGIIGAMPLIAVTLCAPVIFAQAEGEPQVSQPVLEGKADDKCKPYVLTTIAYKVSDLPVWTKDGTFSPNMLVWWIQDSIKPDSWQRLGGPSSIEPVKEKEVFVISTTAANHEAIAKMLENYRKHPN